MWDEPSGWSRGFRAEGSLFSPPDDLLRERHRRCAVCTMPCRGLWNGTYIMGPVALDWIADPVLVVLITFTYADEVVGLSQFFPEGSAGPWPYHTCKDGEKGLAGPSGTWPLVLTSSRSSSRRDRYDELSRLAPQPSSLRDTVASHKRRGGRRGGANIYTSTSLTRRWCHGRQRYWSKNRDAKPE
jgi:hypothetical protein